MLNGIKQEPSGSQQDRSGPQSHSMAVEPTARPPSSPAPKTLDLPDPEPNGTSRQERIRQKHSSLRTRHEEGDDSKPELEPSQDDEAGGSQLLTAIYRPESKAAWREELRAANEKAEKVRLAILLHTY